MKLSRPWSKVVLIVALTIILSAVACVIFLDSDTPAGHLLFRITFYVGPLVGLVVLYQSKFRGPAMVGTSDRITDDLARELMKGGHIVERAKGRLIVRVDKSVGVVVLSKQKGQHRYLYYGLETMPRGAAWVIFLFIIVPPIALFVITYYLSKVIRFGEDTLDGIALNASQKTEHQEKSIKEMLIEGISEARRLSVEAYEAAKSNYDDLIVLSLVSGLLLVMATVISLLYLDRISGFVATGEILLYASVAVFVATVILLYAFFRQRYRHRLGRLRDWSETLSRAFESEGRPPGGEITPDSHFELLAEASREIPGWLEIRRKSMLAREPGWTMVILLTGYSGAMFAIGGAATVIQGTLSGLILLSTGIILICIGAVVYNTTARRMASEAKALEDRWKRRSEQMTADMENLLGGEV